MLPRRGLQPEPQLLTTAQRLQARPLRSPAPPQRLITAPPEPLPARTPRCRRAITALQPTTVPQLPEPAQLRRPHRISRQRTALPAIRTTTRLRRTIRRAIRKMPELTMLNPAPAEALQTRTRPRLRAAAQTRARRRVPALIRATAQPLPLTRTTMPALRAITLLRTPAQPRAASCRRPLQLCL